MPLEEQIKAILNDFENTSSDKVFEVLNQMMPEFRTSLTSEYLQGKIKKIQETSDDAEKKKQCKTLLPYFDWYLQGL